MSEGRRWRPVGASAALWMLFVVLAAGDVASELLALSAPTAVLMYVLVLPLIALAVVSSSGRDRTLLTGALGCCWLGDGAGGYVLEAKLACFAVAHVLFIMLLAQRPRPSAWIPATLIVAGGVTVATQAGSLAVPVAVYGGVEAGMTLFAWSRGPVTAWGAVLFAVSDAVLAGHLFLGWDPGGIDAVIMTLYLAGVGLLTRGLVGPAPASRLHVDEADCAT